MEGKEGAPEENVGVTQQRYVDICKNFMYIYIYIYFIYVYKEDMNCTNGEFIKQKMVIFVQENMCKRQIGK